MQLKKQIRLESVQVLVDEMLLTIDSTKDRRSASVHLYGVAQTAAILAMKRELNPELASIIGMLHDYYLMSTGVQKYHAQNSSEAVRPIIRDMGIFNQEEQHTILSAIFHHEDKEAVHTAYDELIKDADLLQKYLHHVNHGVKKEHVNRLTMVLEELSLPIQFEILEDATIPKIATGDNRRNRLASIAQELVFENIIGTAADTNFRNMCKYWPDDNIYKTACNNWCAMFVFYCCKMAGFELPIKHIGSKIRFGACPAWKDWATDKSVNFYHEATDETFTPQRGDIVIYDKLMSATACDHIGIVLDYDGRVLQVAEGNVDNKNYSGVVSRDRNSNIDGFIRIANDYEYSF
ncbi:MULTISPECIES: CHAP domain-containing protein [unclassified Fusibacter]|uniref:CHAP domain-containing protein n=1 Tax=unclassified Fusibacter TaxID=2624464 RepID=UPI001011DCAC|nr:MULTISPECIES: CHAP domain-containing protein [unclassified Fusibacter]MCK8060291.1 CHAP domain-containing protein [Fusibacter sp. A2]NPE20420.1 CHAP domain-containing protein [Fusibacter sp. A1]RXV63625.1 CHAP domain-containing protein [Fusibacter sp. A1]